ncbi:hypothetical protein JQX13_34865 [Archangium violaceum]|uniref:methyl-accepting chemotaxis protein n=1 Tax=Archangium violaceum TaxID=83451 RepID=UPI00193B1C8D|nr:methyl-accepting chemotaxis protein [Archangium violaceum]QRK05342.1 hypothetical protein JQX13_34865 [Archangium violaceum]
MLQPRTQEEAKRLTWRVFFTYQLNLVPALVPLVYTVALVIGLTGEEGVLALTYIIPPVNALVGMLGPWFAAYKITKGALISVPGEPEERRLERILKAPRALEMAWSLLVLAGTAGFIITACLWFNRSLWTVFWGVFVTMMFCQLGMLQVRISLERLFRPYAIELFHANPKAKLQGGGLLWPRQRWYLGYAFGLSTITAVVVNGTIVVRQVYNKFEQLIAQSSQLDSSQLSTLLQAARSELVADSFLPLLLIETYLLANALLAGVRLARHQAEGMMAVRESILGLATGAPKLPEWLSTDEIGDLSRATANAFDQLKSLSLSLAEWARLLGRSAEELGDSSSKQGTILTRQAAALQETQVTAQEIKQTSALAAQKAEAVLKQAEQADLIRRSGEAAVEQSLDGLKVIREQVKEMENRIKALDQSARQIANITTTVKDLADQSNMLALNAAIEAVRSGEHGKGFGIVAREIRTLADKSIKSTNNVRDILYDISSAIRTTVQITEQGSQRIEESLEQVRASGNNIGQLSVIVRDNASSVKQISVAVTQQNSGIEQIFQAVNELSKMMDETLSGVRASDSAMSLVREVAAKVNDFVGAYSWHEMSAKNSTQMSEDVVSDIAPVGGVDGRSRPDVLR